jgi:hypothetical protein
MAGTFGDNVRHELARIIGSDSFRTSDRNKRFLEFIVDETLEGRQQRLNAYMIATAVFGRDDKFDPQNDPIVRIEATRLRRALTEFYSEARSGGTVRIVLVRGSYVPEFHDVGTATSV